MKTRLFGFVLTCAAILGASGCNSTPKETTTDVSATEATSIATDAYVYGYSLITTEITRVQM